MDENQKPRACLRCGKIFKPDVSGPNIEQPFCMDCLQVNYKALSKVF
jgi:hypothetical protein